MGTVFDTLSGRPLRTAVVRVVATGVSTLTDDAGRYRLTVDSGEVRLEVRRIGYEPASVHYLITAPFQGRDIYLHPIAIGLEPVVVTAADDFALRLIARAIARKHQIYSEIHDYAYQGYVKFVVRDVERQPDSAESVLLITETRTSAYWERPDHYQETILARRQTSNLSAHLNLVSVGDIQNFGRDRIDLQKYSLVSPIADDALGHYDYHVLDTLRESGRRVFRLAIEPRSETSPLFVGMIDIADSAYDVLMIDVGVNEATRFNMAKNLRYRQRLRDVGGGRWMPYEIRLTGEVDLGVPLPGLPEHMAFEHAASLDHFQFDQRRPPPGMGEFRIMVDDHADHPDSTTWSAPGAIPLSQAERAAWARIDSAESIPPDFGSRMRQGMGVVLRASTNADFYHFTRVEGSYVGAGWTWWNIPDLMLRTKLGYAIGSNTWEYRLGARLRLDEAQRLWVGASYHDETTNRPTLVSRDYNPTYRALFFRLDPLDYYRDRGLNLVATAKLLNFTDIDLHYNDVRQSSLADVTDYSVFSVDRPQRPNLPIAEGRLRSVSGGLVYDSRPLLKAKGQDYYLQRLTWTRVAASFEVASPSLIPNDFDFRRYAIRIERRQRTLNLGLTTIELAGGIATGTVPPQRYFLVDFGMKALTYQGGGFNSIADTNYAGTRAAMISVQHDFDRLLFAKSGIPLIKRLPFTLSVHGGVFWTDFASHVRTAGDAYVLTAPRGFSEIGFGLGNLTPFLSPLNFAAHFTWPLTSYPNNGFQFGLSLTPP